MKLLLLTLFLVVAYSANAQDLTDYKNKDYNFVLKYPQKWEKMKPYGSVFVLSQSDVADPTQKSSFDIEVDDTLKSLSLFCTKYISTMKMSDNFKKVTVLSRKDTTFKGMTSIEMTCTAFIPENQKTVQWRSTFFIHNGKVFKLTLSSFPDKFDAVSEATKVIYDTFMFY